MTKTNPRAQVGQKGLTRRNIEVLEAVFHQGNPYLKRVGPDSEARFTHLGAIGNSGGAVHRMVDDLKRRGFIGHNDAAWYVTSKGLDQLRRDKRAMKAIDEREMQGRIPKRQQIEDREAEDRRAADTKREEERTRRETESRNTRLEKLRELFGERMAQLVQWDQKNGWELVASDDDLLDFADKVTAIETIY